MLAIAAAKLGFGPIVACDHEPAALEAVAANARLNGVEVELVRTNLREAFPPTAPTAVANLTAPILLEVAGRLREVPTRLICSGLLTGEADSVRDAFASQALSERDRRLTGDWAAMLLERQTRARRGR